MNEEKDTSPPQPAPPKAAAPQPPAEKPAPAEAPAPAPAAPAAAQPAPAPAKPVQPAAETPAPPAGPTPPAEAAPKTYTWGTGRRKKAIARVRIRPGSGDFLINKREVADYFKSERDLQAARSPLEVARMTTTYDVFVNVQGGGMTGQADAVKLGLARALIRAVPEVAPALRDGGLLTRDSRIKERKKYGLRGARRGAQWAKR